MEEEKKEPEVEEEVKPKPLGISVEEGIGTKDKVN